ncbi:TPR repeat [Prochlorococcus marinus str. MIT 9313]|uniref:TPR repeat n=1 Tax=Prochlorococcus marinus (strain MIT 9313) TaxID=74547 RepID=Q7V8N7_PROMM|nr:tetratricopeptide repeat protein [Prochlorococcus marinus]CAE20475.1 TPR repeat [Prochlorococcus marinus str. MIT 9313]
MHERNTAEEYIKRAKEKFLLKNYRGAISDCSKAIEIDPKDSSAYHIRGLARIISDEKELARNDLYKASELGDKHAMEMLKKCFYPNVQNLIDLETKKIEKDASNFEHYIRRALLKEKFDPNGAIADYSKILEIDSERVDVYFYLALVKNKAGYPKQAIEDCRRALDIEAGNLLLKEYFELRNFVNYLLDGKSEPYQDAGDLIGVILVREPKITPSDSLEYNLRGIRKADLKNFPGAIDDFSKAIELEPRDCHLYVNRGIYRDMSGDPESAISDYCKAIEINPDFADAYYERGVTLRDSGHQERAICDFLKAVDLNPKYSNAYLNIGSIKFHSSDVKGACAYWKKASELENKTADLLLDQECASQGVLASLSYYLNLGSDRCESGDFEGEINAYDKALELSPNDAVIYNNRGNAKRKLEDYQSAIEDYNKSIEINPSSAAPYFNRGDIKYVLDDHKGAIDDYNLALEVDPDDPFLYAKRGDLRVALHDYQGAIADYTKAIEINPQLAIAYYNRGEAKKEIGDLKGACEDWKKAAELGYEDAAKLVEEHCQ